MSDKVKGMIYRGVNSFGDDAYFIGLTDNPGHYFHLAEECEDGQNVYEIKKGVEGATIWTKKNGLAFIEFANSSNCKLFPAKEIIGNDESLN